MKEVRMEYLRTPYVVPCHGLDAARLRGRMRAPARLLVRPRGRECFTPGNFKKDATVRPSHGRPRSHRPSVRYRPRDNLASDCSTSGTASRTST
jgi:hypothetical protein